MTTRHSIEAMTDLEKKEAAQYHIEMINSIEMKYGEQAYKSQFLVEEIDWHAQQVMIYTNQH